MLVLLAASVCGLGVPQPAEGADEFSALAEQLASTPTTATIDTAEAVEQAVAGMAATAPADVLPPPSDEAAEPTAEAPPESAPYQYPPQYHAETAQYHEPDGPPAPPPAEPDAPPASAAAQQPVNVNISVRVLSPGDDGPVSQSSSATPTPAADATGASAPTGSAATDPVNVTVNVSVTINWNLTWNVISDLGQYHAPANEYHNPVSIEQWISRTIGTETDRWNPEQIWRDIPSPDDAWPIVDQPSKAGYRSDGRAFNRTWRGRTDAAPAGRAPLRRASGPPVQLVPPSSTTLWTPAARPASSGVERAHGAARTESRKRSAGEPSRPNDGSPERLAGTAGSAGASSVASFLKMFAILVASLALAGLRSARRLRLPSAFRRRVWSSRPERPG